MRCQNLVETCRRLSGKNYAASPLRIGRDLSSARARAISTSVSNTMNTPATRVASHSRATSARSPAPSAPAVTPCTCAPRFGQLRTVAGGRLELMLLLSLIEEIDDAVLLKLLHPIRSHLDDILAPFEQAESMHSELLDLVPQQILDALVLAWHHEDLSCQSQAQQKRYHQDERKWLEFAEGLLENQFGYRSKRCV